MKFKFLVFILFFAIMPTAFAADAVVPKKNPITVKKASVPAKVATKTLPKTAAKQVVNKNISPQVAKSKSSKVVFSQKLPKKSISVGVSKTNTIPVQVVPVLSPKSPVVSAPKETPEIPVKAVKTIKKQPHCQIKNPPPPALPSAVESTELRKIAKEAALELQDEEAVILGDLRILWQYAVENSETIKFAIYKLSDPKGDLKKADESKIKKLLKPIAGITPFVAATACNPIAAGSSIVGGTFMNDILSEDKYKKHLEKVTDADLVILAKAIEDLQNNLVTTYYEYVTAKKILVFADNNLQNRRQLCDSLTNVPEETVVIADTFYREALARQNQAQSNVLLKRAALEQLVGNDAILLIESNKKPNK